MPKYMNDEEKRTIITKLLVANSKCHWAELNLLLNNEPEQANKLKSRRRELSKQVDRLISEGIEDWIGDAKIIVDDVKSINKKIQLSIRDIQKDVNVAKNVVKIVGYIDEVLEIIKPIA